MDAIAVFSAKGGNGLRPSGNGFRLAVLSFLVFISLTIPPMAAAAGDDSAGIFPKALGKPPGCDMAGLNSINGAPYADGLIAVGWANCPTDARWYNWLPHMWHDGHWSALSLPEGDFKTGEARSISADPSKPPTITYDLNNPEDEWGDPIWWVLDYGGQPARLSIPPEASAISNAVVSAEGGHIVGGTVSGDWESGFTYRAARWMRDGTGWSDPEDIGEGMAVATVADGSLVIGNTERYDWDTAANTAWVWTADNGGEVAQLGTGVRVTDINHSGSVIVGNRAEPCEPEWGCDFMDLPVYWVMEEGQWTLHDLESLDGVNGGTNAVAEIDGQSVIVGWGFTNFQGGIPRVVVWLPEADGGYGAVKRLETLGGNFYTLANAYDINHSGVVVGSSEFESWGRNSSVVWSLTEPLPFQINTGISDAWYNPDTDGQGFFIHVWDNIQTMFVGWFTYADGGGNGSGLHWVTAQGPFSDNRAELEITLTEGGAFDAGQPPPTRTPDGTMTVEFTNCLQGTVTYEIPSIGRQGSVPIQRLASDQIPNCEFQPTQASE